MTNTKHFFVTGHVQGVYFRASTQERAKELGLAGWVRNLDDGRVEVLATGPEAALQALESWLWRGPESAQVENVDVRLESPTDHSSFRVR